MLEGSLLSIPSVSVAAYQEIHSIISEISDVQKQRSMSDAKVVETCQLDDLDVHFDKDGRSQYFSSQHCQVTAHSSDRPTVQFFKNENGSILGRCYNCKGSWWERQPEKKAKLRHIDTYQKLTPIPPLNHVIEKECRAIERAISQAPPPQDPSRPSYPHFSVEQKRLLRADGLNPMAGYHEINDRQIPTWIPKYEKLNPVSGTTTLQ